jgi:hypothetical protein
MQPPLAAMRAHHLWGCLHLHRRSSVRFDAFLESFGLLAAGLGCVGPRRRAAQAGSQGRSRQTTRTPHACAHACAVCPSYVRACACLLCWRLLLPLCGCLLGSACLWLRFAVRQKRRPASLSPRLHEHTTRREGKEAEQTHLSKSRRRRSLVLHRVPPLVSSCAAPLKWTTELAQGSEKTGPNRRSTDQRRRHDTAPTSSWRLRMRLA